MEEKGNDLGLLVRWDSEAQEVIIEFDDLVKMIGLNEKDALNLAKTILAILIEARKEKDNEDRRQDH